MRPAPQGVDTGKHTCPVRAKQKQHKLNCRARRLWSPFAIAHISCPRLNTSYSLLVLLVLVLVLVLLLLLLLLLLVLALLMLALLVLLLVVLLLPPATRLFSTRPTCSRVQLYREPMDRSQNRHAFTA